MDDSPIDEWLYSIRLADLRQKKLELELKEAEAGLETARENLKKLREEQEWERQGGRSLDLPEYTLETLSRLPLKDENQVTRILLYQMLYGRKSGDELLQATISFNYAFPPLARYTDKEVVGYFNRFLDILSKRLQGSNL